MPGLHHRFTTYESWRTSPTSPSSGTASGSCSTQQGHERPHEGDHKRRVAAGELDRIVDEVERVLHAQEGRELSTEAIGRSSWTS